MTGTLAFEGPVDPAATHVTFALNQEAREDRVGAVEDGRLDRTPRFLVEDLPLPGIGLEDEALNPDALGVLETRTVEIGESFDSPDNPDVTVTVISVVLDGRTVEIELEAVNGSSEAVRLVTQSPALRDDTGRRMEFIRSQSEAQEERRLTLGPGDEASARFAFRGSPSPDAQELRLLTNSLSRNDPRSPTFEIVLTLPALDE